MSRLLFVAVALCAAAPAFAAEPSKKPAWFDQAVKSLTLTCDPPAAKPGQTVTLKITLDLADGYTTYPLAQTDPAAAGMVSKIDFPKPAGVIFVGAASDPAGAKSKIETVLGISDLKYYAGKPTWVRKFVVNPSQAPGELTVTLPSVKFAVCDKESCFPPKGFPASATLKVLSGPPTPVEPMFADEVTKALAGK